MAVIDFEFMGHTLWGPCGDVESEVEQIHKKLVEQAIAQAVDAAYVACQQVVCSPCRINIVSLSKRGVVPGPPDPPRHKGKEFA
jgi:hypothetical protein